MHSPAPFTLPKWPFLVGDALLLATAWFISRGPPPLSQAQLTGIVICVALGSILAAIPFLAEYSRRQEEALAERQQALEGLSRTVAASADQISIAATGLHDLTSMLQNHLQLTQQLSDKLTTLTKPEGPDASDDRLSERSRPTRVRRNEASIAPSRTAPGDEPGLISGGSESSPASAGLDLGLERVAAQVSAPEAGAIAIEPAPVPSNTIEEIAPVAPSDSTAPGITRKRERRRSKDPAPAEDTGSTANLATDAAGSIGAMTTSTTPTATTEGSAVADARTAADGITRLLVTAYIGIGNRLFIRGDGGGLNWEKGVPLQFVSIGKWRWESSDSSVPVTCKLLKNDTQECAELGSLTLSPGSEQEVRATF